VQINFSKAILHFVFSLVIVFCFFLNSEPVFAAPIIDNTQAEIIDMKIDADGKFDVYVNFLYSGNISDDLSSINFVLHSFPDPNSRNTTCSLPALSTNPGATSKVVIARGCDFRDAGLGPGTFIKLSASVNVFYTRWYPKEFPFQNRIGSSGEQYFARVYPLGFGKYQVQMQGTSNKDRNTIFDHHRVRVAGYLGGLSSWPSQYSCSENLDIRYYEIQAGALVDSFICDFSPFIALGVRTIQLQYLIGDGSNFEIDTINPVSVYEVNLMSEKGFFVNYSKNVGTAKPNDLFVGVTLYRGYGNVVYTIKLKDSAGTLFSPRNNCTATSNDFVDQTINADCDFSAVDPSRSYSLSLRSPSNVELDSMAVILEDFSPAASGGTCSCQFTGSSCSVLPAASACSFGFDPKVTYCGDSGDPICTCSCSLNGLGVVPGGLPPLLFDISSFQGWAARGQQYIIAFGIFASIFIVPYFGVLLASGNPESIKAGLEWAKSWAFGLLLLLLSSLVIRIIGSDILGF